jgi:hypothetical protein
MGDLLSGRQTDTDAAIQAAAGIFDQWWAAHNGNPAPGGGAHPPHAPRPDGRRQAGYPPGPAAPDIHANLQRAARRVLGFSDLESLTEEAVKERRRKLAKKHHPDHGGSVAMMARINDAADVLIACL